MLDPRIFGPKEKDDLSIGKICPACDKPFKEGDYTTLISLGPGDDPEAQERCRTGRPYNAVAQEVHYVCATGQEATRNLVEIIEQARNALDESSELLDNLKGAP